MKRKQNEGDQSSEEQSQEVIYKKQELNDKKEEKKINQNYTNGSSINNIKQQQQNNNAMIESNNNGENSYISNGSTDNLSKPKESSTTNITTNTTTAVTPAASKYTPQQIDTLKLQYLHEKNLKKLVELCQPLPDIYKEYQKLKYKNKIYSIDDLVLIQNADDLHNDFIGQLIKIIRIENQGKYITLIQIKWYYKKDDLPKRLDKNTLDCISDNEIFETDHLDITFVDCINGPCKLFNYQEYDQLKSISQNTFFTRAKFDTVKKRLIPPFEKWDYGCICKKPLNPDYLYIQCEKCEKWFHIKCIGIAEEDVDSIENYKCPPCLSNVNKAITTNVATTANTTATTTTTATSNGNTTNNNINNKENQNIANGAQQIQQSNQQQSSTSQQQSQQQQQQQSQSQSQSQNNEKQKVYQNGDEKDGINKQSSTSSKK